MLSITPAIQQLETEIEKYFKKPINKPFFATRSIRATTIFVLGLLDMLTNENCFKNDADIIERLSFLNDDYAKIISKIDLNNEQMNTLFLVEDFLIEEGKYLDLSDRKYFSSIEKMTTLIQNITALLKQQQESRSELFENMITFIALVYVFNHEIPLSETLIYREFTCYDRVEERLSVQLLKHLKKEMSVLAGEKVTLNQIEYAVFDVSYSTWKNYFNETPKQEDRKIALIKLVISTEKIDSFAALFLKRYAVNATKRKYAAFKNVVFEIMNNLVLMR